MGAALDRLVLKLARTDVKAYVAKRGNKIVPVVSYLRKYNPAQAEVRSHSPEVLADVKAHPDEFFGTDSSIRLYRDLGVKEPWNEWEWPRRIAANRLADERQRKGRPSALKQASIDETNDAILGAVARTKRNAMAKPPPQHKEPIVKGDFFPDLSKAGAGAPPSEKQAFLDHLKANDWKMYHGTSKKYADEIVEKGLLSPKDLGEPQMSEEEFEDFAEPYIWDGVYLGNRVRADEFAGGTGVVLEIDLKDAGADKSLYEFLVDYEGEEDESIDAVLGGSIPPNRIKIVNP